MKNTEDKCLTCGKELIQVPNKRKKLYCNTTCKSKSWYKDNKDKAKAWRDARKEDKADEKLKEELANDTELTEILEDINKHHEEGFSQTPIIEETLPPLVDVIELKVGDKKAWGKAIKDSKTFDGKKKKTTFKTGVVLPQSKKVEINDLNTPSKGKTKDFTEKKKTNYLINTTGKGVKKESDYLASRRKLKS